MVKITRWPGWLLLLLLLLNTRQLFAHANLLQAEPTPNSVHKESPEQIILLFSEPLEPAVSAIELLTEGGTAVQPTELRVDPSDPTSMSLRLPPLRPGVYTVAWKALSVVDGHLTRGVYPFVVGDAPAAPLTASSSGPEPGSFGEARALDVLARMLSLLGGALLLGSFTMHLALWRPLLDEYELDEEAGDASLVRLLRIGLGLLFGGLLLTLVVQLMEIGSPGALVPFLFRSPLGYGLLVRLVVLLLLFFISQEVQRGRAGELWAGMLFSAVLLAVTSALSHSATVSEGYRTALLNDWLHLTAASLWIGGLLHFLLVMLPAVRALPSEERGSALAALVRRFSPIGIGAVVALLLTGFLSSLYLVGSLAALRETAYGQTLLLKLALVVPLLALAALNLLHWRRVGEGAERGFTRTLMAETSIGVLVLLLVGLLTGLGPGRSALEARQAQTLTMAQDTGSLQATLAITPPRPGPARFEVRLADENGVPYADARRVRLQFTPPDSGLGISDATAENEGGGIYAVDGAFLSILGPWQVTLQVQRSDGYDVFARYTLNVTRRLIQPVAESSGAVNWPAWLLGGLLAAGTGVTLLALWLWRREEHLTTAPVLFFLGAALLLTGGLHYTDPFLQVAEASTAVNPVAPSEASIARGQELYTQHCMACHGVEGVGDGPAAARLSPPPADLNVHAPLHLDGEIYQWIGNGVPDTAMPGFKDVIVEEDRWNIVNYLRVLTAGQ